MVSQSITAKWVLDLQDDDVYWCNADPGCVTGASYGIIGPWANGITQVALDELAILNGIAVSVAQVVQGDDIVTGLDQLFYHMRTDVTGAAYYKYFHNLKLLEKLNRAYSTSITVLPPTICLLKVIFMPSAAQ